MRQKEVSSIEDKICKAIREHRIVRFYYESGSGDYDRKVEPYLLAKKRNGNLFVTGYVYPSPEHPRKNNNDNQGHYLIEKIDPNRFAILNETFSELKLPAKRIYGELPTIDVICRVEGLR